jgi:hypothetical protein
MKRPWFTTKKPVPEERRDLQHLDDVVWPNGEPDERGYSPQLYRVVARKKAAGIFLDAREQRCFDFVLGEANRIPTKKFVEIWCYWRIGRDGTPTVSICDDPMGHPHAHLVRVPIPEDVQKCIDATKNPPLCLAVGKHGEPTGECPKPSNEPETP